MKLTLWLSISRDTRNPFSDSSSLLYKKLETDYVPSNGEMLILYSYDDNPTNGPQWYTKSRNMDADGNWHVSLTKMLVDPSEDVLAQMASSVCCYPWWSKDTDYKPIEDILMENGWREYGS